MAQAARVTRRGPGFIGLIVFIVLSLALMAGYVPLILAFAKRGTAIRNVNAAIQSKLEQPLKASLNVSATPTVSPADVAYNDQFFSKVGEAAQKGSKYDELLKLVGYPADADAVTAIKEQLKRPPDKLLNIPWTEPTSLVDMTKSLNSAIVFLASRVEDANAALEKANAARDNAVKAQTASDTRLQTVLKEKDKEISDLKAKDSKEIDDLKKRWQDADAAEKKTAADATAQVEQFKKQIAGLTEAAKLKDQQVVSLREELDRKKPKPIPVVEGHILQANLVEGFVIIDLGQRQSIQVGEKFTVMTMGKGGQQVPKGEIQISRVNPLDSRADIVGPAFENPIMRGDTVVRQKKFEEAPEDTKTTAAK